MAIAHGVRTLEVIRRVAPHLDAEAEADEIENREGSRSVLLRDRLHQIYRAGHHGDAFLIVSLAIFNFIGLSLGVKMWRYAPNNFERAHSVSDGHDRIPVYAFSGCPFPPLPVDRSRRIDQHAVQIKQNCCASEYGHSLFLYHRGRA